MSKNLKIFILALFVIQIIMAASFELAHDEAYYWLYSKKLDWGYFDHPPVVAILIKIFSFLPESEWSVRFGFVLAQFATLFIIFRMVVPQNFWRVTFLYFAFPLASFVGLLALPDMPLLLITACYCYLLKIYLEKGSIKISLLLGLTISVLLLSKYHGILLVVFTLVASPKLFLRKDFYIVALVALIGCIPHFLWQYQNDFITLKYHFLERPSSTFSMARMAEYLGIQVGLAGVLIGPICWWIVASKKCETEFLKAMKYIAIGTVAFFMISTISKKFEANWTVFLAVPIIVLVSGSPLFDFRWPKFLLYTSFLLVLVMRFLFIIPPETISIKRIKEFHGWKDWAKEIEERCEHPLLANTYQLASKLSFYLDKPIHAQNFHSRKNQFTLWKKNPNYYQGELVCYLTDKNKFQGIPVITPEGKKLTLVPALDIKSF